MLKNKLNNKKGFTLAELLIVVAIIGILVAVSIPVFTSKLEDARVATDQANMRAAKAAAVTEILDQAATSAEQTYYYDAASGMLKEDKTDLEGYGKSGEAKDKVLKVTVSTDGSVELTWE